MTPAFVRVDHRRLQTPVLRYQHSDTRRTVTVIGTYHLGTVAYYRGLREEIDKLEANGAVVHRERGDRTTTLTDATDEEQSILDLLTMANELKTGRVTALGWTGQVQGLGYPDSWHTVDLDPLDIIRRLGLPLARQIADREMRMMAWDDTDRAGFNRLRLMIALLFRLMSTDQRIIKAANGEPADEVIVTARTETALTGVAGTDRDVVLVWGLAHLPGLHTGLTVLGFDHPGPPQWHTVVDRRPSMLGALLRLAVRWPAPKARPATE